MSRFNLKIALSVVLLLFICSQLLFAADPEPREWSTQDGKFKTSATFKEYQAADGKVVLEKKDGKTISVPLQKLSKSDIDYVKKIANIKEDLAPAAKPDPAGKGIILSKEDEQLAQTMVAQWKAILPAFKQPKWEKIWDKRFAEVALDVSFSYEKDLMACTATDGSFEVRRLANGTVVKTADEKTIGKSYSMLLSPNGKYAMNNTHGNEVVIWELDSGKKIFTHKDGSGKLRHASTILKDDFALIVDDELTVHTYAISSGEKKSLKCFSNVPTEAHKNLSVAVSPDNRKLIVYEPRSKFVVAKNLDYFEQKKKLSEILFKLDDEFDRNVSGAFCTNDAFYYLTTGGSLYTFPTRIPEDGQKSRNPYWYKTKINAYEAPMIVSKDGKTGAFYFTQGIYPFSLDSLNSIVNVCIPFGNFKRVWLSPDLRHMVTIDLNRPRHTRCWKVADADFLNHAKDPELLSSLIDQGKFDVLDRVYTIIDSDPELEKYALLYPWSERVSDRIKGAMREKYDQGKPDPYEAMIKWHKATPRNTIGYITYAQDSRHDAWGARGGGFAGTVTEEGYKTFQTQMTRAKSLLTPLMKRDPIPSEALYLWMSVCQAQGWNPADVQLGISSLVKTHPLHRHTHGNVLWSLLPRWHGEEGDSMKYMLKVSESVDPKYADAVFTCGMLSMFQQRENPTGPDNLFNTSEDPNVTRYRPLLSLREHSDKLFAGVDQLIELFPNDVTPPSIGLRYSLFLDNKEMAKKYLKMVDDKHGGILDVEYFGYNSDLYLRKYFKKEKE